MKATRKSETGTNIAVWRWGWQREASFALAVREASKALFLGQSEGNDDLIAHAKRHLSVAYSYAGNLDRAQQYAEEALTHALRPQNPQKSGSRQFGVCAAGRAA